MFRHTHPLLRSRADGDFRPDDRSLRIDDALNPDDPEATSVDVSSLAPKDTLPIQKSVDRHTSIL